MWGGGAPRGAHCAAPDGPAAILIPPADTHCLIGLGPAADAHTAGQHELVEVAPLAAFHAATPFRGGHIVVRRQVGMVLAITAYGAQQQVGEETADEDGHINAENNADPLAHVATPPSRSGSQINSGAPPPPAWPSTSKAPATVSAIWAPQSSPC